MYSKHTSVCDKGKPDQTFAPPQGTSASAQGLDLGTLRELTERET